LRIPEQLRLYILFLLGILFLVLGVKFLFPLVSPFLSGLAIAYLIERPVVVVGRWFGLSRSLAVIFVLVLTLLGLGFCLTLLFLRLYQETKELLITLPDRLTLLGQGLTRLETAICNRLQWPEEFWGQGRLWVNQLWATLNGLLQGALNCFRGLPLFLLNLLLSGLTAFFFSRDRGKIKQFCLTLIPEQWQKSMLRLHRQTLISGWNFLKAQIVLAMVTGFISSLCLGLFGFAKPWLTGLFIGIVDILPLVGPVLFFLPWLGWQLAVGQLAKACYLGLTCLLTLGLRQLVEIRLVGVKLGLHPLLVLLSLYLGMKSLGVYGFFFGPVLCVLIRSLYQVIFDQQKGFWLN
jgi:sporulation integral membrane protein YtvI